MNKTDVERIKKILRTWAALNSQLQSRGITREVLLTDEFSQWAVTTPLYNIGEQVYYLSKALKAQYPEMPWSAVAGIRHRLVHDYEGINWSVIVEVVYDEMPDFIESVKDVLRALE